MGIRDRGELCLTLCTLVLLHFNLMDGFLYTSLPPNKKDGKETGRKKGGKEGGRERGREEERKKTGKKEKTEGESKGGQEGNLLLMGHSFNSETNNSLKAVTQNYILSPLEI